MTPFPRIYFVDGLKEGWKDVVAQFANSDDKETLVVLEDVIEYNASKIHYDRIEDILTKIKNNSDRDVPKDDKKNTANKTDQSPIQQNRASPCAPAFGTPIMSEKKRQGRCRRND